MRRAAARWAGLVAVLLAPLGTGAAPPALDTLGARPVEASVLEAYRADDDFRYDRPQAQGASLWTLAWRWIERTFLEPLASASRTRVGTWVMLGLAVALLAWGLTRLLRLETSGPFSRRLGGPDAIGPLLDVEALDRVDLAPLLAAALADGRLRDAVRFRFLLLLQRLDRAGALAWRRDKTNRDYVREVAARGPGADAFADAARAFDYVWYGERGVDARRYARLDPLFARAEALAAGTVAAGAGP